MEERAGLSRLEWALISLVWLGAAAVMLYRQFIAGDGQPLFQDTDDAMRIAFARDFLNGQPWFDFTAHRLNTPYGAELHWSRFVDLPIAALLAVSTWVSGPNTAMEVTGAIWPLLLLGALLYLSVRITKLVVGPEGVLPAALLPVLNPALMAEFEPGRVDHHNVVLLLTLATVFATLAAQRRPLWAWLSGFFAAFSLAVAIEALPLVAGAILAFGLAYVFDAHKRVAMARFGASFALSCVLLLATARLPDRWLEAACDMISPVYVLAALLVGASFVFVALLPQKPSAVMRFVLLAIAGIASIAVLYLVYPQCFGGPYGELDPWLQTNWLAHITEARPWLLGLKDSPVFALVVGLPVLLGMIIGAAALRRDEKRDLWMVLVLILALAGAAMMFQIRGSRLATMVSVPMAAWLIVRAREDYLSKASVLTVAGLIISWIAFTGVALTVIFNSVIALASSGGAQEPQADFESRYACLVPEAFADLAALPPERIMTPIDLGAHIMLYTAHHVVAAPYHRNEAGVLDAFRFFRGDPSEALEIARRRELTLLVTCEEMSEMRSDKKEDSASLLALFAQDKLPDWLTEVPAPGPLKIYSIALQ